jgi:Short C-terminal domain
MMMRRRRPLLRATMVGGAAYHAGKSRQAPAPAPAAAAPASAGGLSDAAIAQLKELAQLKEAGVLTVEEFDAQKKQLLGS